MTNAKTAAKTLIAIATVAAATFAGAASAATPINEQWGGDETVAQGPALSRLGGDVSRIAGQAAASTAH